MQKNKIKLRTLLVVLSAGGVLLTSALLLTVLYAYQKSDIENSILSSNIAYARKLADVTDRYFRMATMELSYSAGTLQDFGDQARLSGEADRLRGQSGLFNSVVVVNNKGVVQAASPESLSLNGLTLTSESNRIALADKKTYISSPFTSAAGNYVVFLSHPVFSASAEYLGYIGGTVYLKKKSILSDIIGQHFYLDSSEISIVSNEGDIIYNHNPGLVGSRIALSPELKSHLAHSASGRVNYRNNGRDYLLGYADIGLTGWNIFIYGNEENVSSVLWKTIKRSSLLVIPVIGFMLILMTVLSYCIAYPLRTLAELVRSGDSDSTLRSIKGINTWYDEAEKLKSAVYHHILLMVNKMSSLNDEAMTDPLTGTYNRRGFDSLVQPYLYSSDHSLILLDVDHFKKINDRYGHKTGDAVLVRLAQLIMHTCRSSDIVSRFGGEEFIVFLPDTGIEKALFTAERIRLSVAATAFHIAGQVTISAGVSAFGEDADELSRLIGEADSALYHSKGAGRNRTSVSHRGKLFAADVSGGM
ncbi:diguanylate cyclase [Erwiniaceae bacterium BAC15a-03b]|uniref:diguanylate cyclase n=1 Tax=Winslowiella arboricola TaxID=2978220 RepID=A0A9J6PRE9_9GAMM|nr:diguanylate cyclase [Winslowiella arboricola]MCU5774400.1 diguanylate cyclase [Winslowiella arboricola]MCU5778947.1 diguanylate cyclase [Winslowiella arboricola]